ncbi:hypothetical protein ABZY44_36180 [Streptomyces sp. NPDC006544]|uniref:hypothetical protein n=1 Tax=Streptomyces sp. NPDC006544 TaxID=3154583 RepID=UPI0033B78193
MTRTGSPGDTVLRATGRIRDKAAHVARLVEHKTPDPVRDRAVRTAAQVRDAASRAGRLAAHKNPRFGGAKSPWAAGARGRSGPGPAMAAAGVLAAALLVRRARRARHQK